MALLSVPYDFVAGTTIVSGEVDADFAAIVDALIGTSQKEIVIRQGNTANPALIVDNDTGTNRIVAFKSGGTTLVSVKDNGQITSAVNTGTAPLSVASTTMVENLNADMVGGKHGTDLVESGVTEVLELAGAEPALTFNDSVSHDVKLYSDGTDMKFYNVTADKDILVLGKGSGLTVGEGKITITTPSTPSEDGDVVIVSYLEARTMPFSVCVLFPGSVATDAPLASWIVPVGIQDGFITMLKAVRQAGAGTGTTTCNVKKNGVSIGTVSLTSQAVGAVVTENISDESISANDVILFDITSGGDQEDVTVGIVGTHKLSQ